MSDQGCLSALCGLCCVTLFSAFEPWCNSKRFGGNCCACCCGGPRGCCHSCFDDGFNKDSWDEEDARKGAKETEIAATQAKTKAVAETDTRPEDGAGKGGNKDTDAKGDEITEQPPRTAGMDSEGKSIPVGTAT